jgi:DNA topoisomerase I
MDEIQDTIDALEKAKKTMKKNATKAQDEWESRLDKLQKASEKEEELFESLLTKYEEDRKLGKPDLTKPNKPKKFVRKKLPKDEDAIDVEIEKLKSKLKDQELTKKVKDDNKTVALGTSKINYCDPRISVAWCKRNDVPLSKIFNKSLIQKFPWAMDIEEDYKF